MHRVSVYTTCRSVHASYYILPRTHILLFVSTSIELFYTVDQDPRFFSNGNETIGTYSFLPSLLDGRQYCRIFHVFRSNTENLKLQMTLSIHLILLVATIRKKNWVSSHDMVQFCWQHRGEVVHLKGVTTQFWLANMVFLSTSTT